MYFSLDFFLCVFNDLLCEYFFHLFEKNLKVKKGGDKERDQKS